MTTLLDLSKEALERRPRAQVAASKSGLTARGFSRAALRATTKGHQMEATSTAGHVNNTSMYTTTIIVEIPRHFLQMGNFTGLSMSSLAAMHS